MSVAWPVRLLLCGAAAVSLAGALGAQELTVRFAYRSIEVSGVTPGASLTVLGVTREADGLDFDHLRESLRDGDGDGMVRVEFPRDLPLSIVAAIEDTSGRAGVGSRGIDWAYDQGLLRDHGVDIFWLRPGIDDGSARVDRAVLDANLFAAPPPHADLPEFFPDDLVFAVDLTTLRSVLVILPERIGPATPPSHFDP